MSASRAIYLSVTVTTVLLITKAIVFPDYEKGSWAIAFIHLVHPIALALLFVYLMQRAVVSLSVGAVALATSIVLSEVLVYAMGVIGIIEMLYDQVGDAIRFLSVLIQLAIGLLVYFLGGFVVQMRNK